ncbi:hypothetical protein VTN02DRAFT_4737 [Thermoascus thermophilus]
MRASGLLLLALSAAAYAADVSSNTLSASHSDSAPASSLVTPPPALPGSPELPPSENPTDSERLEAREVVKGAPPAVPTEITQVDSVTTIWEPTRNKAGDVYYAPVTYTQTFASVPDQWPQPSSGSIGLGTLTGKIGVTKTIEARDAAATKGALKARSEGTLGQSPWIGMAVGLTCTALAAVMLG